MRLIAFARSVNFPIETTTMAAVMLSIRLSFSGRSCTHPRAPRLFALIVLALLTATGSIARAAPSFSQMISFGDSLSDRRNVKDISFGLVPFSPYADGRFSNGPLWVEQLSGKLGLGAVTASRDGGRNFAHAGVKTGDGDTVLTSFLGLNITAPDIGKQVTGWTGSNNASSTQLFTMLGGGNDIFSNFFSVSTPTMASNMTSNVQRLYNDGARHILIANLPDLGKTPRYRGTAEQTRATLLSNNFNNHLANGLNALEQSSPGLNLYRVDTFALFNAVIANPGQYGFTNVTQPVYIEDGGLTGGGDVVGNPANYVFWDDVHPTTAAHALLGNAAFVAIPEPSALALIMVIVAIGSRRRRVNA